MKNKLFILLLLTILFGSATAQLKIGSNPTLRNVNSLLELEGTTKGFLLSRVSLTSTTSYAPLTSGIVAGFVIYNTNAAVSEGSSSYPVNLGGIGLYYWDGGGWVAVKLVGAYDRANHTGFQTSTTISDFDAAVAANGAVAANTSKVTNATHTGDVTGATALTYNNVVPSNKGGAGTINGIIKANGSGTTSLAVSGTDYLTPTGSAASLTSFPTFNQNTTGSAATLTTPRSIYGNNFDGSAALTGIIGSTFGGTGNGFTKFSGATTAEKTYTLPNASATILTDNTAVTLLQGGTGATTAPGARTNLGLGSLATQSGTFSGTSSGTNTGDQTITLTGDITGSGTGSFTTAISANAVTLADMAQISTANILGRVSALTGNVESLTGANVRTIIGANTIGSNLITLANPSAITFPRFNADNTITSLDAASFRTAIGAGTSSTVGTVTSVGGTGTVSGLSLSGTVTTTGNLTLGGTLAVTASNFASQTANTFLAANNGGASVPTFRTIVAADIPTLNQNTSGTAATVTTATQSSITSIPNLATTGTITSGTWSGSFGAVSGANLTTLNASNLSSGTVTFARLPSVYVGTTAIQSSSANQALTGISSVTLPGATSGTVQVIPAAIAGTGTVFTLPATTGTAITTGDVGTVTNTMLAGSIATAKITGLGTLATQSGTFSGTSSGTNTGDQTITLTGDITGTGTGSFATSIANNAVALADIAQIATASFLGRSTAATGNVEVLSASTARTTLGATTVGGNLFTLTNPSAITFPRFNADNTVTARTATELRSDIGAGTGSGTVTSVGGTGTVSGLTLSGTVTGSGNLTLGGILSVTQSNLNLTSDITVNSVHVGKGAVSTGTRLGENALASGSLSGSYNTAVGSGALRYLTTGSNNVGIGYQTLNSASFTGSDNMAIGTTALLSTTSGYDNTAIGTSALPNLTTALGNVAIGKYAGYNISTGASYNTFVGHSAGGGITTGNYNTIIGALIGSLSSTLSNWVIIGDGAGNRRINIDNSGRMAIGSNTPNTAAMLEVTSTTSGLLLPRMTTTQRDAIGSPPAGLLIFNTTTDTAQIRKNSSWADL